MYIYIIIDIIEYLLVTGREMYEIFYCNIRKSIVSHFKFFFRKFSTESMCKKCLF